MGAGSRRIAFVLALLAGLVRHHESIREKPWFALPLLPLAAALAFCLARLAAADADGPDRDERDPLARLRTGKRGLFAVALLTTALLFADVLVLDRSLVSAPWFSLEPAHVADAEGRPVGLAEREPGAGFDRLIDPWAGFFIEGPAIYLTGAAFRSGDLPLWNPFEACGTPYAANAETAVFSVLQLPLHLFPSLRTWDLYALLRTLLAVFLAALAARALGASRLAAAWAGLAFGFGGVFVLFANLVHLNTALVLPLVLVAVEALAFRRSPGRIAFFAAMTALALNGGNPQPLFALFVLLLPRLLLAGGTRLAEKVTLLGSLAAGGLVAVALNGPGFLLLAELLGRSANRTLFDLATPGESPDLLAFAAPPFPMGSPTYGIIHQPQFWYFGAFPLALALAALPGALLRGDDRTRGLASGLLLAALFLFTPAAGLFSSLPVIGGLRFSKYVAAPQLMALVLAAPLLDRLLRGERTALRLLGGTMAALIAYALFRLVPGESGDSLLVLGIFGCLSATLVALPRGRRLAVLLPLLLLLELGLHLPRHPERPPEPLERWPAALASLRNDLGLDDWVAMDEREAAFKDAAPPMLSGLLGWHDFRSVTPLPLGDYHRFMAPWVNCGPWPPYLLLGASREIMLAPVFDHVGVRFFLLREEDFDSVVRSPRAELLEDEAVIRFGELQRAMRYGGVDTGGLLNLDPYRASVVIAPGVPLESDFELAARSARIGFSILSPRDAPFRADGRIGDRTFRLDERSPSAEFELADPGHPVRFRIEVEGEGEFVLRFDRWQVERHITKGRFDFDDRSTPAMTALGVRLLENRYPLPTARAVRRSRYIRDPEEFWRVHRAFAATGAGWQPREETFIEIADEEPRFDPRVVTPAGGEQLRLERKGFDRMRLHASLRRAGPVFVAVAFDPGWRAFAGDRELAVRRADGAFIAVDVDEPGGQVIDLVYRPRVYDLGLWLAALGLVAFFALVVLARRDRERARPAGEAGRLGL